MMANESHLYEETKMLPTKDHSLMLSAQYAIACHLQNHTNVQLTNQVETSRHIKADCLTMAKDIILQNITVNGLELCPTKRP